MKTIKDLILKEKSYIITIDLYDDYYIWIECLGDDGNTLTRDFNEKMLEDNLFIELYSEKFDDPIAEWSCYDNLGLECEIDFLIKTAEFAIELYESEQE